VEQRVTMLVNIPMTKVRAIEIVAVTPANILMPAARTIIGMSNKKAIICHHTY
jgi:hypothetical protein